MKKITMTKLLCVVQLLLIISYYGIIDSWISRKQIKENIYLIVY